MAIGIETGHSKHIVPWGIFAFYVDIIVCSVNVHFTFLHSICYSPSLQIFSFSFKCFCLASKRPDIAGSFFLRSTRQFCEH